jgi:hypothetical protein
MDTFSWILRLTCFFLFLFSPIQTVPTMNAIRDESRLDDGIPPETVFPMNLLIAFCQVAEYMDLVPTYKILQRLTK